MASLLALSSLNLHCILKPAIRKRKQAWVTLASLAREVEAWLRAAWRGALDRRSLCGFWSLRPVEHTYSAFKR
jgi:hypothetical protein